MEADETHMGGKEKNKRASKRKGERGSAGKHPVLGMKERGGKTVAKPVDGTNQATLHREIAKHVEAGSAPYTNEHIGPEPDAPHGGIWPSPPLDGDASRGMASPVLLSVRLSMGLFPWLVTQVENRDPLEFRHPTPSRVGLAHMIGAVCAMAAPNPPYPHSDIAEFAPRTGWGTIPSSLHFPTATVWRRRLPPSGGESSGGAP